MLRTWKYTWESTVTQFKKINGILMWAFNTMHHKNNKVSAVIKKRRELIVGPATEGFEEGGSSSQTKAIESGPENQFSPI